MSSGSLGGILANAPLPLEDPIAQPKRAQYGKGEDPQEGHVTRSWLDWFTSLTNSVTASSTRIASVVLTDQSGNIGATDISNGALAAGLYRFSFYASITAAGGAGQTVTPTLDWTEAGLARAYTGSALDATDTSKSDSAIRLIRIDGASPVRYSVVRTGGRYTFAVILETIQT